MWYVQPQASNPLVPPHQTQSILSFSSRMGGRCSFSVSLTVPLGHQGNRLEASYTLLMAQDEQ